LQIKAPSSIAAWLNRPDPERAGNIASATCHNVRCAEVDVTSSLKPTQRL
jgi:hypothetical protein